MSYIDAEGELAFVATVAIGALTGGFIDAAITAVAEKLREEQKKRHYWRNVGAAFFRGAITGAVSVIATPSAGSLLRGGSSLARGATTMGIAALGSTSGQVAYNSLTPDNDWDSGLLEAAAFGALGQGVANRYIQTPRWGYSLKQMRCFGPKKISTSLFSRDSSYVSKGITVSSSVALGLSSMSDGLLK